MQFLYIDPGTGSMLFSIVLGLVTTLIFVLNSLFLKIKVWLFADDKTKLKGIVKALEAVNAKDIKIYHMTSNHIFDYGVVASAVASRQMDGLVSKINELSEEYSLEIRGVEGRGGNSWLLVDLGFAIVNLFNLEERNRYDLDKIWAYCDEVSSNI